MPLSSGLSIHDDTKHKGSAKRDVVNGVAGLDALGHIVAPGKGFSLTRGAMDDIVFYERTSGNPMMFFTRLGYNDFKVDLVRGGAYDPVQTNSDKNVANGIAGLDASVEITSRLAYENIANGVAGLDADAKISNASMAGLYKGYLISDDILHSHDTPWNTTSTTPQQANIITINTLYKTPKTLRISFKLTAGSVTRTAHGQIYKNGASFGTARTDQTELGTTFDEDLSFAEGDTIEMWLWSGDGQSIAGRNLRVKGLESQLTLQDAITDSNVGLADPFIGSNS